MVDKENFVKDINVPGEEPIMIDGVDIIDCDYFYVEQETDQVKCDLSGEYCRENKNCYFKQLKHKEQECDKYENALDSIYQYIKTCICEYCISKKDVCVGCYHQDFLDIINKAKDTTNET